MKRSSRAKGATPETINCYYDELEILLETYNLKDKPSIG